ncbi:hypothetical protein BACT_0786 [Bifidobacterium actinocoloniiforme DSM 22766]|uniref:ABC-2 family transporter protein n=1 Tax=Bifidobacterium actinocoloniiforme DSM 22766 TaxID=1437605 RepID=A0A086Z0N4_9BIFI|nr:ABC-2 transporter permease [Bifidobacterium actinocoloniiforme]AKV55294.1 hypothetical protein AB656_02535 [Bifidobacterium actinocoloniiforme DSM 22766]KFI40084.1 hypothetical protein BACT_0786 [Bifidobacterium actinocoloniiforme DSM 22766]
MNGIIAQVRLDNRRLESYGKVYGIALIIALPVIMALVMGLSGAKTTESVDGMFGGICGSVGCVTALYSMYPFLVTEQSGDIRFDGMIPISRSRQVLGRYIMSAFDLLAYLVGILLVPVVFDLTGTALDMPVVFDLTGTALDMPVLAVCGICLLTVLLLICIFLPLLYRFNSMSVLKGMSLSLIGLVALGFLISRIPQDWAARIAVFLTTSVLRTVILGVLVAVLAVLISIACSLRIYGKKEL